MKLSVTIPTYNRSRTLQQGLASLQQQTFRDFEILVVDNAADPVVEKQVAAFSVRYVPEPQLGLHNARHAGARAATGSILIFTDDDATYEPNWLRAYADAFDAHADMAAAGGPVRPVWETKPPQWLLDYIGDTKEFGILSLREP